MKSALQILLVGAFALLGVCPLRAGDPLTHSTSAAKLRHRLLGRWTRQKKGTDGQGICLIDIVVEFRADGHFLYARTFHAVDHPQPTWDSLENSGTWRLRRGVLIQHWDGNGEHPGGYTTRWALLHLSTKRLRYVEGEDKAVSYYRPPKQARSAVPPNHALQRTQAGGRRFSVCGA